MCENKLYFGDIHKVRLQWQPLRTRLVSIDVDLFRTKNVKPQMWMFQALAIAAAVCNKYHRVVVFPKSATSFSPPTFPLWCSTPTQQLMFCLQFNGISYVFICCVPHKKMHYGAWCLYWGSLGLHLRRPSQPNMPPPTCRCINIVSLAAASGSLEGYNKTSLLNSAVLHRAW